jgi:hypothetical protein
VSSDLNLTRFCGIQQPYVCLWWWMMTSRFLVFLTC